MSKELPQATDQAKVFSHIEASERDTELAFLISELVVSNDLVKGKDDFGFSVNFANAVLEIINKSNGDIENRIVATAASHSNIFGVEKEDLQKALETTIETILELKPLLW